MKRMCLADFDETLISTDSFKYMMLKEKWYLRPGLFCAGVRLALSRIIKRGETGARNAFKLILLQYYSRLSADRKRSYTGAFRSRIREDIALR